MKLTNKIRNDFIRRVIADIPVKDFEQEIRDAVATAVWRAHPPEVRTLLSDPDTAGYINTFYCSVGGKGLPTISMQYPARSYEWLDELAKDIASPNLTAWRIQNEKAKMAVQALEPTVLSCTTLSQLRKALPELLAYMPEEDEGPTKDVPVVPGLVDSLRSLGWQGRTEVAPA